MRVVPSRRGLVVTFLGVAALGYATGVGAWLLQQQLAAPTEIRR